MRRNPFSAQLPKAVENGFLAKVPLHNIFATQFFIRESPRKKKKLAKMLGKKTGFWLCFGRTPLDGYERQTEVAHLGEDAPERSLILDKTG